MFHWCQKVNVYNIQNHYHFYSNQHPEVKEPLNLSYKKLKVDSISFLSTNTKRSSRSCIKKGLNISKKLSISFNPQQLNSTIQNKNSHSQNNQPVNILDHIRSTSKSIGETLKQKIPDHQNNNSKQILTASHESFRPDQQYKKIQKIEIKRKPSVFSNKKPNTDLMQKLYLTAPHSSFSNNINNIKYIEISPLRKCQDIQELTTSRNIRSKQASGISSSARQSQISISSNNENNSKYNVSIFDSLSISDKRQNIAHDKRESLYHKYLQISRGQARQASIILSNILSRSNDKNYSSSHQRTQSIHSQKNKRRFNLQDKQTILSHQNDMASLQSVKIEESELCEMDPKNNFEIIPNKSFGNSIYSVDLAIQNYAKCIVSLKEIAFREMSFISQQLQIYQFVEQVLSNRDSYRNILELYQVQTTNNSYLLIKQPYTHSFNDYIKNLSTQQVKEFILLLQAMIKPVLIEFGHHMMYPTRLLTHSDFVICQSVIKIHDLSVFKQIKNPPYTIDQIIEGLDMNCSKADTKNVKNVKKSNGFTFFGNNSQYLIKVSQNN